MTVREMAELIIKMTDSNSNIVNKTLPVDDPKVRQPNISLAKEKLGWEPKVSVEEGIKRTISWFRSQKK